MLTPATDRRIIDAAAGGDVQHARYLRRLVRGVGLLGVDDGTYWAQMRSQIDWNGDIVNAAW